MALATREMSWAEIEEAMDKITDKVADGQDLTPSEELRLEQLERAMERRNRGRW